MGRYPVKVPKSKYTAEEAIQMVEAKQKGEKGKMPLVAVMWCRADKFEGPQWLGALKWQRADEEWSWFLIYSAEVGGSVATLRLRENGEIKSEFFMPPLT